MATEQIGIIVERGPAGEFLTRKPICKEVKRNAETERFDREVEDLFVNCILDYLKARDEMEERRKAREALFARINKQKAEEMLISSGVED